jgi:DNA-3-methyladenine glycosylase
VGYRLNVREPMRLPREFFARSPLELAPALLGCRLAHGGVTVRITEAEAYAGELDPGSHAYRGVTPRTRPMFGPPGFLYVYFTYGNHWCVNVVAGESGSASAVLLRGAEVVAGHDVARERRPGVPERDWCRGPGRLTKTLALDGAQSGKDLCVPLLGEPAEAIIDGPCELVDPASVRSGPRVGVSGPGGDGTAYPWRFWIEGEPTVSTYRPGVVRQRKRT